MQQQSITRGLVIGVVASLVFGTSGAFMKPLLENGWSPGAAVFARVGVAGIALLPVIIVAMRGRWNVLWRARWRVLGMGVIGVAGTQLMFFAAVQRIPVSTALLIEYLAPLLLVGWVWATTRRMPRLVIILGSVVAIAGLALVIGPGSLGEADGLGLAFAGLAAVGCAIYYLIAERPSDGLPSVVLAGAGLILGAIVLGLAGLIGLVPFSAKFEAVPLFGTEVPWWAPVLFVAIIGTAVAYATSIRASELLGSRLMSFVGLLEVVAASVYAWLLLGEELTIVQMLGGALILAGIALVRSEKRADAPIEPGAIEEPEQRKPAAAPVP